MENFIQEKLKEYSQFKTEKDIIEFEKLLEKMSKNLDTKYIPFLFETFDDNTEFYEVMYSVVHILESYPDEVHAKEIIKSIPYMSKQAPGWLLILIYRILNHPSSLQYFRKNMHLIPQRSMIELLDLVARESEHHRKLCNELKQELLKED